MALKLPAKITNRIAQSVLQWSSVTSRHRQGVNLREAQNMLILYTEENEAKFKLVRDIAQFVKKEFGVKHVMRLAYVDKESKQIPAWHMRKLEGDFFCKSDLNWFGKTVRNVGAIVNEPYDVLIHFDPDQSVPLDFVVMNSKSKLKVSNHSKWRTKDYDILLPVAKGDSWKQRNHRIIQFLAESPLS